MAKKELFVELCSKIRQLFQNFKKKFFDENLTNEYVISFCIP
jgi:hypothetical protein